MKRALFLLLACIPICLSSCSGTPREAPEPGKISVVATNFPAYDFARQVGAGAADVTMLLPPGGESHSYEPTAQDILKIQNCDLFVYTGGESDSWVDKVLHSLGTGIRTLKMMDCVSVIEEDSHGEEEGEYDEHVWTSPVNAVKITGAIQDALCEIDSAGAERYAQNAAAYIEALTKLDQDFREFFGRTEQKTLIFGDRFPLLYFVKEYGLEYEAAFPGCAEHTEPIASTIVQLIDDIKEKNISTIYYIEFSNHTIADSLAETTGTQTALFYTCHNVSKEQLADGATYLSLMRENLETLKQTMH